MKKISYYKKLRNKYTPKAIKLIFILESPPASDKYFYDESGQITEPLFKAMMQLIHESVNSKKIGLEKFMNMGYFVVDATYRPVNKLSSSKRNQIINQDFDTLLADLKQIDCKNLLLVKKNVCKLLAKKLADKGFNVLNFKNSQLINAPFPAYGWQKKFHKIASRLIS